MKKIILIPLFFAISIFSVENKDKKLDTIGPISIQNEVSKVFHFEGYFRSIYMWETNLDLDSFNMDGNKVYGSSQMAPTIIEQEDQASDESTISYNLRLRLTPKFQIGEYFEAITTIDTLDNTLLGADSDDKIVLKEAYGALNTPFGLLKIGRVATHWGLGIFKNSGKDKMAIGGNYIDQISLKNRFIPAIMPYLTTELSYHIKDSGVTSAMGGFNQYNSYDLEDRDDYIAWVLTVGELMSDDELDQYMDTHNSRFNWGLYLSYEEQNRVSSIVENVDTGENVISYEKLNFYSYTLDLYLAFHYSKLFKAEMEAIWRSGELGSDKFDRFGAALKTELSFNLETFKIGIDGGFATGDEDNDPYDAKFNNTVQTTQSKYNNYIFNNDFQVDLLFFKKIADITNVYYIRPHLTYMINRSIALDFWGVYTSALTKEQTFGRDTYLGTELDLQIEYVSDSGLNFGASGAIFIPGDGMNWLGADKETGGTEDNKDYNAEFAYGFNFYMIVKF